MNISIQIKSACLHYNDHIIFNNLNCTIPGGKTSCLLGPSGVGKTSLLRHIAGLITPCQSLHVTGEFLASNNRPIKDQISYMAQNDPGLPWLTVKENVMLGARLRREISDIHEKKALELLEQVGLGKVAYHFPQALSGGMRSRLALARTLFENKPIVLLDEPFASVDAITKLELQSLLSNQLKGKTVILVTHDPLEALRIGDYIYVMSGSPANCKEAIKLSEPTPRNPSDDKLLTLNALLLNELSQAAMEYAS